MGSETTMKYKIGDKVKIINSPGWDGKICKIIKTFRATVDYPYRVQEILNPNWECPVKEKEIELTIKIGEQLLLFEL